MTFVGELSVTVTVAELVPFSATDEGESVQLELGGPPLQLRATEPRKFPNEVSVTVKLASWPEGMVCEPGAAVRVKSLTVRMKDCVTRPAAFCAVTVRR